MARRLSDDALSRLQRIVIHGKHLTVANGLWVCVHGVHGYRCFACPFGWRLLHLLRRIGGYMGALPAEKLFSARFGDASLSRVQCFCWHRLSA